MSLIVVGNGEHSRVVWESVRGNEDGMHVAFVGQPGTTHRREFIEKAETKWATIVHPSAIISTTARIGDGVFVGAGAIIQTGAFISDHCVINTGAIVEHDCILGVGVHMAPRSVLGGGVSIGAWSTIGLGACVRDHVQIGSGVIVGMGAVVVNSIPNETKVMGVPAK
jgi:sugar O-acyltransferase (sialic acid O-acetyltransferase NeuD family)